VVAPVRTLARNYLRATHVSAVSIEPHPPIRIIVENGHVTLQGVVGSDMDRTIAYMQANSVPGAFPVTNNLQIGS
jgi:osmotically-inducible protein OsmY